MMKTPSNIHDRSNNVHRKWLNTHELPNHLLQLHFLFFAILCYIPYLTNDFASVNMCHRVKM